MIFDLYLDLQKRVNKWAAITKQTAQARMGYVRQHLTSVVTEFPGDRSGVRGRDLVLPHNEYAEIKTCYRVDQLGQCNACGASVASIEPKCPRLQEHTDITRKEDSKWWIGIRHAEELAQILEPKAYTLVLFDFMDLQSPDIIRASIWEVDPKLPGFAYCMVDYHLNMRADSSSKAPFNLWPYQLKFCLMRPLSIYQATISAVDVSIRTLLFPGRDPARLHGLRPLDEYARSRNLTSDKIKFLAHLLGLAGKWPAKTRRDFLTHIQRHVDQRQIGPATVADKVATALYRQEVEPHGAQLPEPLKSRIAALSSSI